MTPLIIGHRGCAGLEPENSLGAFRRAIELGVNAIELDVRLSRDGVPVVIHDETLERTTDGRGCVKDFTLEELCNFQIRSRGAERPSHIESGRPSPTGDLRIPTLDEVLELASRDKRLCLFIELKASGTPAPVLKLIRRHATEKRVMIISFDHELLRETRQLDSVIGIGALWDKPPRDFVERAKELGASAIDVKFRHVTPAMVAQAHVAVLKVFVWTVNAPTDMRRMMRAGVDGITTDFPDRLLSVVSGQ